MRRFAVIVALLAPVVAAVASVGAFVFANRTATRFLDAALSLGQAREEEVEEASSPFQTLRTRVIGSDSQGAWRIEMTAPERCHRELRCIVTFRLVPAFGWHANAEYPWKVLLSNGGAEGSLTIENGEANGAVSTFRKRPGEVVLDEDGSAAVHVFVVPHAGDTASVAGQYRITGELKGSACDQEQCRIGRQAIDVTLGAL